MLISMFGMIVVRQVFLAVSMRINHSIVNVCIGYPLAWLVTAILIFVYYHKVKNKPLN